MEKYRTFFPRLVALLIDNFIMLPLGILTDWFQQAKFPPLFFYIWIPISVFVFPVYTIMMHGHYGQTLGKMAMNVKVLDVTEEPIKFSQAIWREIPQIVQRLGAIYFGITFLGETLEPENLPTSYEIFGGLAAVWILADIMTFFYNEKRRALHDFIAGTVVVKTNL